MCKESPLPVIVVVILSTNKLVKKHLRESLWEFFPLLLLDTEVDSIVSVSVPQQLSTRIQVWLVLWTKTCQLCVNHLSPNSRTSSLVCMVTSPQKGRSKPPPWNTSTRSSEWSTSTFTWTNSSPSQSKTTSSNNPKESDNKLTSKRRSQIDRVPSDTSSGINLNFQWNQ